MSDYTGAVEVVWETWQGIEGICPRTGRQLEWSSQRQNCTREQMLRYGKAFLKAHMEPRMHWLFRVTQTAQLTSPQVPIIDDLQAPGSGDWLPAEEAMREAVATLQEWHDKEVWSSGP
jgi:hypothetical protein